MFKYIKDLPHDFLGYKYAGAMAELQVKSEETTKLPKGVMIKMGDSLCDYIIATDQYVALIIKQDAIRVGGESIPAGDMLFDAFKAFGEFSREFSQAIKIADIRESLKEVPTIDLAGEEYVRGFLSFGDSFFVAKSLATIANIAEKIGLKEIQHQGGVYRNGKHFAFFKLDENAMMVMRVEKFVTQGEYCGEL